MTGQVIVAMKESCRRSVLHKATASARLVEPMLLCQVQCNQDQMGKMYGALGQRRAQIQKEDLWEGTPIFHIEAFLPATEAFGLADALRKQTSGAASNPQLVFSHWAVLDEDPFFVPTTEEELEEFGETAGGAPVAHNLARRLVDALRKRKGLALDKKIVVNAEKQRTLARKK